MGDIFRWKWEAFHAGPWFMIACLSSASCLEIYPMRRLGQNTVNVVTFVTVSEEWVGLRLRSFLTWKASSTHSISTFKDLLVNQTSNKSPESRWRRSTAKRRCRLSSRWKKDEAFEEANEEEVYFFCPTSFWQDVKWMVWLVPGLTSDRPWSKVREGCTDQHQGCLQTGQRWRVHQAVHVPVLWWQDSAPGLVNVDFKSRRRWRGPRAEEGSQRRQASVGGGPGHIQGLSGEGSASQERRVEGEGPRDCEADHKDQGHNSAQDQG